MKKINLFVISLIFFSFSIFFLKNYFFGVPENKLNEHIEENFIEPSINKYENIYNKTSVKDNNKQDLNITLKSAYNIEYLYFPESLKYKISDYIFGYKIFLNNKDIVDKIDKLRVEFYKTKNDVRGKMKNRSIKLFGIKSMRKDELTAVGIHEFGHFLDLYFLKKGLYTDLSYYFYNISWNSTKVLKAGQTQSDFVSGYAMTNKYEDFAESFTYFVLHNEDFLYKANKSDILKKKYNFFIKYLFRDGKFVGTDFSDDNEILDYYRDITKIKFSLENFLLFLKK
ncbi:putative zinc-binding metallopeptidase [Candidatus Gracilibacteria bacterium]|nr:putative zinc-binding metallopeptidase [Candidatus Gracilibacteria bacterium]